MNWNDIFNKEKYNLSNIMLKVSKERLKKIVYPPEKDIFNTFYLTPFNKIKVVIIGQDPYCSENQAHGLAFSVRINCNIPPSLKNIYKEIIHDLSFSEKHYDHGCLINWSKQGVLLLNSILTVEKGYPKSHILLGWEKFTDNIIFYINLYLKNIIFLLWGRHAIRKKKFINCKKHYVFQASHPSPLSAHLGFFGCRHFSKVNNILLNHGKEIIYW